MRQSKIDTTQATHLASADAPAVGFAQLIINHSCSASALSCSGKKSEDARIKKLRAAEDALWRTRGVAPMEIGYKLVAAFLGADPDHQDLSISTVEAILKDDTVETNHKLVASAFLDLYALDAEAREAAMAPKPDAELLALAPEFERRWALEEALNSTDDHTDEEAEQACEYTGEIAHRIHAIQPMTLAGFKVRAQAVKWHRNAYDTPYAEESDQSGTDVWASAHLVDALVAASGGDATAEDPRLLAAEVEWDRLDAEDTAILDHWPYPDAKSREIEAARQAPFETVKTVEARTLRGLAIKAKIAAYEQPPHGFIGWDDQRWEVHRALVADTLKLAGMPMPEGLFPLTDEEIAANQAPAALIAAE